MSMRYDQGFEVDAAPNRRTLGFWPALSLGLTVGLCILLTAWARQAQDDYQTERSHDIVYQQHAALKKALLEAYIIQITMMQDQINHPLPKPGRSF